MKPKKFPRSFRLSGFAKSSLAEMAEAQGLSKTQVVEKLIKAERQTRGMDRIEAALKVGGR